MKVQFKYIRKFLFVTILVIVCSQIAWVYNAYQLYQEELKAEVDNSLERAIYGELSMRFNQKGGFSGPRIYSSIGETPNDNHIVHKTVTKDNGQIFEVDIDSRDPNAMDKFFQFLIKEDFPFDINRFDSLFREELAKSHFQIKATYVDYLDLKEGKVIETNKPTGFHSYSYTSDNISLDHFNTIGVKVYVNATLSTVLDRMLIQLGLSIVMISIAYFCLTYLSKTIFTQHKAAKIRQTFVSTMTHEFKRPIANATALLGVAIEYLNRDSKEKVNQNIQQAQFQLNKLDAYTRRIQEINRNEESKIQLNKQEINAVDFLQMLHDTYEKSAAMKFSCESKQSVIYADAIHFSNVMDNLVENAIKYSDDTAQIHITLKEDSLNTILSVQDQGYGIADSDKRYIFDKFFRVRDKRIQEKSGFGLGLTYVKAIVEAHGGKISVESKLNRGSVFTVAIPLKN